MTKILLRLQGKLNLDTFGEKMNIAIDLDGVVFDFVGGFLKYFNSRYNMKIEKNWINKWDWHKCYDFSITKEQFDIAFKEFTEFRMWTDLNIFPEARDALCSLAGQGNQIFYLTDRPKDARRATLKAILSNGLPIDSIIFTSFLNKADVAKQLDIKIAIDDKIETIESYYKASICSVKMNRPYNTICRVYNGSVNNLQEFKKIVEECNV